jgi:hypothetical protein
MKRRAQGGWLPRPDLCLAALALCLASLCATGQEARKPPPAGGAADLRAAYQRLSRELANNQFQRPLHIESADVPGALSGDVHAVMEHPFAAVKAAFGNPANWCDMLILHVNTKYCRAAGARIEVQMGSNTPEPLDPSAQMAFTFRVLPGAPDYFRAELGAERGPLATRNYRIRLEAIALPGNASFLRLSYAYESGPASHRAMQAYLAAGGRNKIGFNTVGLTHDGRPVYVDGLRALVERNIMRYYLAVDTYLDALAAPPGERFERRIDGWFNATELYARQLHDIDRRRYLDMKREEYRRQQAQR